MVTQFRIAIAYHAVVIMTFFPVWQTLMFQCQYFMTVRQGKGASEPGMPAIDDHILLDDNRYIADVVYDFKVKLRCSYRLCLPMFSMQNAILLIILRQ